VRKKITSSDFYQFLHVRANPIQPPSGHSYHRCVVNPATSAAAKMCGTFVFITTDFCEKKI